mmetsp:Transcript_96620/g.186336  ORF Transcript_96620/g.186336 Transcript_96620/m.186336 type:complete len:463 (+) Transcript_96620:580-1968(+)
MLAMSVCHECPLGLLLVPSLCKQLLGQEPSFEDLQFVPGLSDNGTSWYRSLCALLAHRRPELVKDDPSLVRLDAEAASEAVSGLEAVMPSRAEQVFQSLAAHVGVLTSDRQRWPEATEVVSRLLREASSDPQRELAADRSRDLLETINAELGSSSSYCSHRHLAAAAVVEDFCGCEEGPMTQALRQALRSLRWSLSGRQHDYGTEEASRVDTERRIEQLLEMLLGSESDDKALELQQVACERRPDDPPEQGPRLIGQAPQTFHTTLARASSRVDGPGLSDELTMENLEAFADALAMKALSQNLQPHLGRIVEEFRRVVPQRTQQSLTWQQVRDRISGRRLDPEAFVREWRDRTTYQSCSEADESVRLWWGYVSDRTAEELSRLFAWCTGFAAIPVTAWKFQIKVVDDVVRCPSINTCMTDDPSAANRGVKMPTIYLPAYDSQATLARKMEWAIAGASAMHLH